MLLFRWKIKESLREVIMQTDFSECSLIEEEMRYYTYTEFCEKRKIFKKKFEKLSKNGKIFYKYYVYANIHMNETYKNAIWDYLNGYDENGLELTRMARFYKGK